MWLEHHNELENDKSVASRRVVEKRTFSSTEITTWEGNSSRSSSGQGRTSLPFVINEKTNTK